jgi:hypothetical protein
METGMMVGNLEKEPSSMFNDPCGDTNKMESQSFETSGPPGLGQCLSFHHGEDIVGDDSESPPGRIGKEAFRWQYPSGQIILQDIVNLLYCATTFPLPPEQSLPIPTPHIGDYGKVVIISV